MTPIDRRHADPFIGGGEVATLAREKEWGDTSLGPVDEWSDALRTTVRTILESPYPTNLWCGPERVLLYNDAYRQVLGSKHPNALGRPGNEVWAEIWEEIAPMFTQVDRGQEPVYAEAAPFVIERGSADGGEPAGEPNAWFTFSLSPVRDADGAIVAYLNIVSEVTRQVLAEEATRRAKAQAEHAEARLREVFGRAPAFMAVLRGEDHVFEYVNQAYYGLVGHRELIGLAVRDALPEVKEQGFLQLLDGVLETGEPYVGREVPVFLSRTDAGEPEERFVDFVYYPITEADGTRTGVVAHGSDVTEHVLARRDAQNARAEAERANQAKSHFLANMSHEIRTPINAVMGYADLLDAGVGGVLDPAQQEYVDRIRVSNRHLLQLIDEILDFSKIEAGEMTITNRSTPARPLALAALQMVAPQAESAGIELTDDWRCGDETCFVGDGDRVRQILLNLLSNAIKFTERDGTVTLRCSVSEHPDPEMSLAGGPWVVLAVEDTGSGIPDDALSRIFDPFTQEETGHTRRTSGTGLGLTISRQFAHLMDGELAVRSEVGMGSSFYLWLPRAADEPASRTGREATRARPELERVGRLLLDGTERLEAELVGRLAEDAGIPSRGLDRAALADHTAPLLAVLARSLSTMSEADSEPGLLADSDDIRHHMAARHGRQRHRLGWTRSDVAREYRIFHDVLDSFIRREAVDHRSDEIEKALTVAHRLLDEAAEASLSAHEDISAGAGEDGGA